MKHCLKRMLSLSLAFFLTLSLLPAALAEEALAADLPGAQAAEEALPAEALSQGAAETETAGDLQAPTDEAAAEPLPEEGEASAQEAEDSAQLMTASEEAISGTYSNGIQWHLDLETFHLTITGSGDIPDEEDWSGKRVETAFIGEGITSLRDGMFQNYGSLVFIQLPSTLKRIGDSALYCTNITGIQLPYGLEEIGADALLGCDELRAIYLPGSVTTIGDGAFQSTHITSMVFPNSVASLGTGVLAHTEYLRSVTLPAGLTEIPDYFFQGAGQLRTVEIPSTVTRIGSGAFKDSGLASIRLPEGLTELGTSCFNGAPIQSISIPGGVDTIPRYCFRDCTDLKEVIFSEGLTAIESTAFWNCASLTALVFPSTLETISGNAFTDCPNLTGGYFRGPGVNADYNYWSNAGLFNGASDDFTIYYMAGQSGWDDLTEEGCSPTTWYDYPLEVWDGSTHGAFPLGHYMRTLSERTIRVFLQGWKYADGDVSQTITAAVTGADGQVSTYSGQWNTTCTQFKIPLVDSDTVVFTCEGYEPLTVPATLLGSFNLIKLWRARADGPPILQHILMDRSQGEYRKLYNLHLEEGVVFVPSFRTYDLYVDVNWKGHTPAAIWLMEGARKVAQLQAGWNYQLPLGQLLNNDGSPIYIRMAYDNYTLKQTEIRLLPRESSYTTAIEDGDKGTSEEPLPEKAAIMEGRTVTLDLSQLTRGDLPLEVRCGTDGTVRATIGITLANYNGDHEDGDWSAAFSNIRETLRDPAKVRESDLERLMRNLNKNLSTQTGYCTISSDIQVVGYLEGYFRGKEIVPTECAIVLCIKGRVQIYYPVTSLGVGTFYATTGGELTIQLPFVMLAAEEPNRLVADGSLPLNGELKFFGGPAIGNSQVKGEALSNGEITLQTTFPVEWEQTSMLLRIFVSLEGEIKGARASVEICSTPKFVLLENGVWWSPQEDAAAASLLSLEDAVWTEPQRDYLAEPSDFPANDAVSLLAGENSLVTEGEFLTNVYPYARIQQAAFSNGDRLVVWLGDNPDRADGDRTALYYSFYAAEADVWSEPRLAAPENDGDGTADSYPRLRCVEDIALLVWGDASASQSGEAGSTTTLEEIREELLMTDVGFARFDRAAGAFTDHAVLEGGESCADLMAEVTLVEGLPTVVWVSSTSGDLSLAEEDTTLYTATLTEGGWVTEVQEAAVSGIDALTAAEEEGRLAVYYTRQPDGGNDDLTARELYRFWGGEEQALTDNDLADTAPAVQSGLLTWYQEGGIRTGDGILSTDWQGGDQRQYVRSETGLQAILYTTRSAETAGLYAVFCDVGSHWGQPVLIAETQEGYFYDYSGVFLQDDTLSVMAAQVDEAGASARLVRYDMAPLCDLKVTGLSHDPYSLTENGSLALSVEVENTGPLSVHLSQVTFYDGDAVLGSCYSVQPILSGASALLDVTCPLEGAVPGSIRVEVLPVDFTEPSPEDNSALCDLSSNTDLSLEELFAETFAAQEGSRTQVTVQAVNRGVAATAACQLNLHRDASDGTVIAGPQEVPSLDPGASATLLFALEEPLEAGTVVYAVADVEDNENLALNNSIFTLVREEQQPGGGFSYTASAAESTEGVTVSLCGENPSSSAVTVRFITAAYKDGQMLAAHVTEALLEAGAEGWVQELLLDADGADTVKVFLVDENSKPLSAEQTLSLTP